jgi:hypothetical protein
VGTERFFFNLTGKRSLKTEIVPGGSKDYGSKRSGKAKEKRNGTIGLMGGFISPKSSDVKRVFI